MKTLRAASILIILFLLAASSSMAQDAWPKTITADDGTVIKVYEPQPESFDGNTLKARSVVSILDQDSTEPVFGTFWAISTVQTDRVNRFISLVSVRIPNLRFASDVDPDKISYIRSVLEARLPSVEGDLSLDAVTTSLETDNQQKELSKGLNNTAPQIYYSSRPSILVTIDGEPRLQRNKDWDVDVVVNSPFTIVKNNDGNFYLYGQKRWYVAPSATGPYRDAGYTIPANLQRIEGDINNSVNNEPGYSDDSIVPQSDIVSDVIVTTQPAELIQTDGEPVFTTLDGTQLQFITNTDNDIFRYGPDQQYYVLLSGRWYRSPSLQGQWSYVESSKLPADFARIPEGSPKDDVLANVSGTQAARDAVMDAQIPQTAKVDRHNAQADITYDGQPDFDDISGTDMQYAVNTQSPVIRYRGTYYCVDKGVWFESFSPNGPWTVCIERPSEVDIIPPTCPVYNVKYVYIYDVTPDWVYTGYTPGYLNTFIYGGTVVYGTGFYYRPWFGNYYYPRPYTWGFGVTYNPWEGYSLGWDFGYGWLNTGIAVNRWHGWRGGWWGPAVYRPPYRWGGDYRRGGYYGSGIVAARHITVRNNINIYNYRRNVVTVNRVNNTRRLMDARNSNTANGFNNNRNGNRQQNVYSDRQGNVYERNAQGQWQQRQRGRWTPVNNNTQVQNLERQNQLRVRGEARTQTFQSTVNNAAPNTQRPQVQQRPQQQNQQRQQTQQRPQQRPNTQQQRKPDNNNSGQRGHH
ncbi:MAG TPA: hypothetical protein VG738_09675 [Chitinophagaceae bacterium]|nr:hypothetical protein [Chitinophagaceae bacterium]